MTDFVDAPGGRRIAYHRTGGRGPWIVFLGGYASDMTGTKATHLEAWAKRTGRAFLRFDYSGHGASSGAFEAGTIGDWAADARAAIDALTEGPVLLVGSSMGGWIALLVARALDRVAGFVGIAAAPDFTEDSLWAGFTDAQKAELERAGKLTIPTEYDAPHVVTARLIEEGRERLVLRGPLPAFGPVRLLHGTADADVAISVALRLLAHLRGDVRLTLVRDADHRFSDPACLELLVATLEDVLATLAA